MAQQRTQTRTAERTQQSTVDEMLNRKDQPPATSGASSDETARLPPSVIRRGIDEPTWRTLCNSVFPGALGESILMAVDYCRARNLDVLKKPCHIVPMEVKEKRRGADGKVIENYVWRDVILPGIYEYRITARRTGEYCGRTKPIYGPIVDFRGLQAPEFCEVTIFRWSEKLRDKVGYTVEIYFSEVVATKKDGTANRKWTQSPRQMLFKCAEAAGLREAFPDELGGEPTAEEMEGRTIDVTPPRPKPQPKPATQAPQETSAEEEGPSLASPEQIQEIRGALEKKDMTEDAVLEEWKLAAIEELEFDAVPEVLAWIAQQHAD